MSRPQSFWSMKRRTRRHTSVSILPQKKRKRRLRWKNRTREEKSRRALPPLLQSPRSRSWSRRRRSRWRSRSISRSKLPREPRKPRKPRKASLGNGRTSWGTNLSARRLKILTSSRQRSRSHILERIWRIGSWSWGKNLLKQRLCMNSAKSKSTCFRWIQTTSRQNLNREKNGSTKSTQRALGAISWRRNPMASRALTNSLKRRILSSWRNWITPEAVSTAKDLMLE